MKIVKLLARLGAKLYDYSGLSYTIMDKAAAAAIERREEAIRTLRYEEERILEQIEDLRRYRI